MRAAFHARKKDNTRHALTIGGRKIEVYFSPGDNAVDRMVRLVAQEAQVRVYFEIFAWSSQALTDALKRKWEGNAIDLAGTRTGFEVRGVFDNSYWDQWWSASIDMTGRSASRTSAKNPVIRWRNPAPVYPDADPQKLHAKTMLIDPGTDSDPTVVVGSTNWSANGEDFNDENMLIIHDRLIVNQFLQEFYARYREAGGAVPEVK
jgi:phosphatidylserine/phosphatidylglycerophosphate/cardiolipin synthase-like enzyme